MNANDRNPQQPNQQAQPQEGREREKQEQQPQQQQSDRGSRQQQQKASGSTQQQQQQNAGTADNAYGEGNYQATRDYNERTKRFIESGRVDEAARNAAPGSEQEAQEMEAAEAEGRRHAKEEDPEITLPEGDVGPEDDSAPRPGQE